MICGNSPDHRSSTAIKVLRMLDGHDVPMYCLMGIAHPSAHDKTLKTDRTVAAVLVPMQELGMKRKRFRSGTSLLCGFLWFYTL